MSWKIVNETASARGRSGRVNYSVRLSRHTSGAVCIAISEEYMKSIRWKPGDRVNVLLDEENGLLGLARTTDIKGYTISKQKAATTGNIKIKFRDCDPNQVVLSDSPRLLTKEHVRFDKECDLIKVRLLRKMSKSLLD